MFAELTQDEMDVVCGGMGNSPSGRTGSTPVNKGGGSTSCSDGVTGGAVAGLLGGLATANPIGFAGVFVGATLGGAVAGGCFSRSRDADAKMKER